MGDLGQYLNTTVKAIYGHWKKVGEAGQYPTVTIGAGQIGSPCERQLWYTFRHCCRPEFDGRMYRLFDRGNLEEARIEADLKAIGCEVHMLDANGKQFRVSALGGHVSGRLDGAVLGVPEAHQTWHVMEIKTHSAKSYAKLVKSGVKVSQPKHYAQVMIYMHLTGMKRALYIGVNKDTEELYVERIRYNKEEAGVLLERAERVIKATSPPVGISDRPDYYLCKWCDAKNICFGSEPPNPTLNVPLLSCRQCCHATPTLDGTNGRWVCEKHGKALTTKNQENPCGNHLCLPGLFTTQEVLDCDKNADGHECICFEDKQYGKWRHGNGRGRIYSSEALRELPLPLLNNGMINTAMETFGAKVINRSEDILDRYLPETSQLIWSGKLSSDAIETAWYAAYKEEFFALKPIATCNFDTHSVAEYENNRIVVAYPAIAKAYIWEQHEKHTP